MPLVRLFTDFEGRIGLGRFWFGSAVIALTLFSIQNLSHRLGSPYGPQLFAFASAFALFPWAALAAKRATDRGSVPLFGILLVCIIVLPELAKPHLSVLWTPSLDTISLIAWVVALVDLGLFPSVPAESPVAELPGGAKPQG